MWQILAWNLYFRDERVQREAEACALVALGLARGSAEGGNRAAGPSCPTSSGCRIGLDRRKEPDHHELQAHRLRAHTSKVSATRWQFPEVPSFPLGSSHQLLTPLICYQGDRSGSHGLGFKIRLSLPHLITIFMDMPQNPT